MTILIEGVFQHPHSHLFMVFIKLINKFMRGMDFAHAHGTNLCTLTPLIIV
jgi:hypothetical protein